MTKQSPSILLGVLYSLLLLLCEKTIILEKANYQSIVGFVVAIDMNIIILYIADVVGCSRLVANFLDRRVCFEDERSLAFVTLAIRKALVHSTRV